jgi:hypothetical protein
MKLRTYAGLVLPLALAACSDRPMAVSSRGVKLMAAGAVAEEPVFRTDSSSVNGSGCWVNGTQRGCVSVSRSRIANGVITFLFYSVDDCQSDGSPPDTTRDSIPPDTLPPPPVCRTVEGGFGQIPNSDLAGSGIRSLSVRTNTSVAANPDFTRFAGTGGDVAATWTRSGAFSTQNHGTAKSTFGAFTIQTAGSSWFSDALLAGDVVRFAIVSPTFGQIFRSQQLMIGHQQGP